MECPLPCTTGGQAKSFENGAAAFAPKRSAGDPLEKKVGALEDKLVHKDEVLSELMKEHVKLSGTRK